MKVPFVDLPAMLAPQRAEYLAAFGRIIDQGSFVGGPDVGALEQQFAAYVGAPHAVAVRTGTDALLLALRAMGVGPGDEVITAANSFFATAEAISLSGATPVFADIDDETLLIDPDDVARCITPRTKCLIPVHLYGQVADMDRLVALGLPILQDSAQAHGATRGSWRAGSGTIASAFSFYPTKNLGALGEGGLVTTSDEAVAARIRSLRDHGQSTRHCHVDIGYNARLDSVQCACLAINLSQLDAWTAARREHAAHYRRGLPGARFIAEAPGSSPVYHLMVVRVAAGRRDAIRAALDKAGIATAIHYPTPIHRQPVYARLASRACPVAETSAGEILSLPMFPTLTEAQVAYVCEHLGRA